MKQDKEIIKRLELAAKIAKEGLNFQVLCINDDDPSWKDCSADEIMRFTELYTWDEFEMRLAPQPVMVQLDSEDVPPGSVIRNKTIPETWETILFLGAHGIINHEGTLIRWDELYNNYEIKRPGEDWKLCQKER